MKTAHIDYLLSGIEELLVSEGDRLLLSDITEQLEVEPIDCIESFVEDIFKYSTYGIDEEYCEDSYIELFTDNEQLHFRGELITKELWLKAVPLIEDRFCNIENTFRLTELDLTDDNAPVIGVSIEFKNSQEYSDAYSVNLSECGLIVIFDSSNGNTTEQFYFSPKLVHNVIDYIKKINYLSLESTYVEDSKSDELDFDNGSNLKRLKIDVAVGDRFKKVCNYDDCNSALADFWKYVYDLISNKLMKYTSKPEKCVFCESTNISDFTYTKPISEVISEAEKDNCSEVCHCAAKYNPAWVCGDCKTIYFKK